MDLETKSNAADKFKIGSGLVANEFKTYMGIKDRDSDWVWGKLENGVFLVNDTFYDLLDMFVSLEYQIPKKTVKEWKQYQMDSLSEGKSPMNLYSYWRSR